MGIGLGAVRGAVLGLGYTIIATPAFALSYFRSATWMIELLPYVFGCSVFAGTLVGAAVVVTRAYSQGQVWRAQLAMVLSYVLTGIVFYGMVLGERVTEALQAAVMFAPVFIPLGLAATWGAIRWERVGRRA
jgi:hypothetical protein